MRDVAHWPDWTVLPEAGVLKASLAGCSLLPWTLVMAGVGFYLSWAVISEVWVWRDGCDHGGSGGPGGTCRLCMSGVAWIWRKPSIVQITHPPPWTLGRILPAFKEFPPCFHLLLLAFIPSFHYQKMLGHNFRVGFGAKAYFRPPLLSLQRSKGIFVAPDGSVLSRLWVAKTS